MITESEDLESDYRYAMRWEEEAGEGDETEGGEGYETDGGEGEESNVIIINDNDYEEASVQVESHNLSGILVEYFTCPCCKIPVITPFDMCIYGHVICKTCHEKLRTDICPTCRGAFCKLLLNEMFHSLYS